MRCFPSNYKRADNLCYSDCLPRDFPNTNTLTCDACPYDCYTCNINKNYCLSCNGTHDFREMNQSTSRCQPLVGYFENMTTICPQCPSTCFSCTSQTVCTSCQIGHFMRADKMCYSGCLPRYFGNTQTLVCDICIDPYC